MDATSPAEISELLASTTLGPAGAGPAGMICAASSSLAERRSPRCQMRGEAPPKTCHRAATHKDGAMRAAELFAPTISEPLTWDEICARHPTCTRSIAALELGLLTGRLAQHRRRFRGDADIEAAWLVRSTPKTAFACRAGFAPPCTALRWWSPWQQGLCTVLIGNSLRERPARTEHPYPPA